MSTSAVKSIWIEHDHWSEVNLHDGNTDVIVTLSDGKKYVATFFTYKNIGSLTESNQNTGECLSGKYFWASDMILIDQLSRQSIETVISHLIEVNEFTSIFKECRQ